MRLRLRVVSVIAICLSTAGAGSPAWAQWTVNVSGPDVFGNIKAIAFVPSSDADGLVVQCNSTDQLDLAYITSATASELDRTSQGRHMPAQLLIKVDEGRVYTLDAELRGWNNTQVGVVVSGRTPELVFILHAIGAASNAINIGIDIGGNQESQSLASAGSTNAMTTVIKDCKLTDLTAFPESGARKSTGK